MTLAAGDTIGIKLMNGQEIICKLDSETDTHYNISDAMFWDLVAVGNNKHDFQFSPLSIGQKGSNEEKHFGISVQLPKQAALFPYIPRHELEERYRKMTSPIVLLN